MVRVIRHPWGVRVYVLSHRLHHGMAGSVAAALLLAAGRRRWALGAALLAVHDARDFPFRDTDNHEPRNYHA